MKQTMKTFLKTIIFASVVVSTPILSAQDTPIKYVRYEYEGRASYGVLDGNTINELRGSIFESSEPTGKTISLADVKLLVPTEPSKVIAIGFNYRSHIGDREPEPYPGVFAKYPSSPPPSSQMSWDFLLDVGVIPPGAFAWAGCVDSSDGPS